MQVMDIFAYHSYHSDNKPEVRYTFKKDFVEKYPQFRFDMSEWCELPNKSHTKSFKGALITARIIGQDIVYAGAQSWTAWVAVNGTTANGEDMCDATLSANQDFTQWYICKRYYGFQHFSKYIPVGSTVLDIAQHPTENNNQFNIFAFLTPKGETVLVAVNEGEAKTIEIDANHSKMRIIKSTQDEELKQVYDGEFCPKVESESNSILTIILQ
jgi:O-glycosyl hydrolase